MKKTLEKKEAKTAVGGKPVRPPDQISAAAYYRWLERGTPWGDDWADWFEVENKWPDPVVTHS